MRLLLNLPVRRDSVSQAVRGVVVHGAFSLVSYVLLRKCVLVYDMRKYLTISGIESDTLLYLNGSNHNASITTAKSNFQPNELINNFLERLRHCFLADLPIDWDRFYQFNVNEIFTRKFAGNVVRSADRKNTFNDELRQPAAISVNTLCHRNEEIYKCEHHKQLQHPSSNCKWLRVPNAWTIVMCSVFEPISKLFSINEDSRKAEPENISNLK